MKKLLASSTVLAMLVSVTPALAYGGWTGIHNNNNATIGNTVVVGANTGGNTANGNNGGNGGNGGNVWNSDDDNTGGNGGNGSYGGNGGAIYTGSATAGAVVENDVNSNLAVVNNCGCENRCDPCYDPCQDECDSCQWREDGTEVNNYNHATVWNNVVVGANTGGNIANAGRGGDGGHGGDVGQYDPDDNNTGGNGGAGGHGGNGGIITTGWSDSYAQVVNVVNTNITRIRR